MKERPNMLYSLQLSKKKNSTPLAHQPQPTRMGPTLQAPASDVTKQDTELSPAQTPSHPPNPAPLANNGHWKMDYPQVLPIKSRGPPQAQQQWTGNQTLGALAPQTMVPRMT